MCVGLWVCLYDILASKTHNSLQCFFPFQVLAVRPLGLRSFISGGEFVLPPFSLSYTYLFAILFCKFFYWFSIFFINQSNFSSLTLLHQVCLSNFCHYGSMRSSTSIRPFIDCDAFSLIGFDGNQTRTGRVTVVLSSTLVRIVFVWAPRSFITNQ